VVQARQIESELAEDENPFLRSIYSRANCLHPKAFFLRIDGRCNQDCDFCNILAEGGSDFRSSTKYVKSMLRQISNLKPRDAVVNFTGGEPTLRKDLVMLTAYAKHLGIDRVVLQTNAIRFKDKRYLDAVIRAGLDDALISFHSHIPEISDKMTRAPGTWAKTHLGIENALAAGLAVSLNVVISRHNIDTFADTIDYIIKTFPTLEGVIISPMQPHGRILNRMELFPSYTELKKPIRSGATKLMDAGIHFYLSYCENPLCWLLDTFDIKPTQEVRQYIVRRLNANTCGDCHLSTTMDKDKVKTATCETCYMQDVCFGLWRKYDEHFGHEELRPAPFPERGRRLKKPFSVAPYISEGEKHFGAGAAFKGVPIR
jgi:MoaA/NifB/PqqE/SkfB family radical SAM enzyme